MGKSGDLDALLARADRVDAQPHTVRRGVGLGVTLLATAGLVACIVLGIAQGLLLTVVRFVYGIWPQ
ncbi:hypothetical protein C1N91_03870 [Curtobacterium sp. SGAir0471]|uniref:hypothetical protein n=1 Tax=Curtobacterium sp. SGAir0471 TaxID=2070337 RepID=UPI0010CCB224|nr:hypothetical protein [Curtobacterium sp. SGAir0471]QCR42806.1 hypothetical protein C1N91_03870 [Curtobacterium sp. SGAir0471]